MSFFRSTASKSADCIPPYGSTYVFSNKYITASAVLPTITISLTLKLGAPNWAKNSVRYREIFRRDTISRYQSQNFGIWIQYLNISLLAISHDVGIWYPDLSRCSTRYHTGSPRNTRQMQIQPKPTTSLRSTLVFSGFASALILACRPSGLFRRPSVVHQLDTS